MRSVSADVLRRLLPFRRAFGNVPMGHAADCALQSKIEGSRALRFARSVINQGLAWTGMGATLVAIRRR